MFPMRRMGAAAVVLVTVAGGAGADTGTIEQPILGGEDVPFGTWRDTAVILVGGLAQCSGILVGPTVVLTAGHCDDPALTEVIVGANDLSQVQRGERIAVEQRIPYPEWTTSYDVTALVLERASTIRPRAIATGWARIDIADGARVELVGFGAINRDGNQYVDALQEVETTITDADCSDEGVGCNLAARPGGELGAGGMGKDTCPGDSGGPLYLRTDYGDFLAGLTSRAYTGAEYPCQDGGIYVRPDAIVAWIESATGAQVEHGPEPTADRIEVVRGDGQETSIHINDPVGDDHEVEITTQPAHGAARARDDGRVRYCAGREYTGPDAIGVTITDAHADERQVQLTIAVDVVGGDPPPEEMCSLEFDDAGCCAAGSRPGGGAALLVVAVGVILGRRRR